MNDSRILITGAGGFIGRNLANYLSDQGHDVIGIDLTYSQSPPTPDELRFRGVTGDFRNQELLLQLLDGVDVVFHLASAHLKVNLEPAEYWDVNVHSLASLLPTAQSAGVKRFIHVSSVGIYGRLQSCPASEETPCQPQSIYGQTKWAGEQTVREFARQHRFSAIVLRPAWVYGTGCPRTAKICRTLRKRRFVMIGPGRNLRHPLYIADFLQACELAMRSEVADGEPFLIAGEQPVTSRDLIEAFCAALELPRPAIRIPYHLGQWIARSTETLCRAVSREPPISRRTLEFFDTDNAFDISKAKQQLGFQPKYCLERGLKETAPWLEYVGAC